MLDLSMTMTFNKKIDPVSYAQILNEKLLKHIPNVRLGVGFYVELDIPDDNKIYQQLMQNIKDALAPESQEVEKCHSTPSKSLMSNGV